MNYSLLNEQLKALSDGVSYDVTILANASALLYDALPDLNWCGFYIFRNDLLELGPFQGKPACVRIELGKGVCGTAAIENRTCLVPDVHQFPGHIACDSASNSEIVIPLHCQYRLYGVLDIDSPVFNRFSSDDQKGLEMIAATLEELLQA